jgi:hypothetical protein
MRTEDVRQNGGLIVEVGALDVEIDFLETYQVGLLSADDVEDARKTITPVAAADAFVDVVAQ